MDKNLEKALELSDYRLTLYNRKQDIKLKLNNSLLISYDNNVFKATKELISFIKVCLLDNITNIAVFDINDNPVLINDLEKLYSILFSTYTKAYNECFIEYEKLKKSRNVEKMIL